MYLPPKRRPSGTAALVVLLAAGACADPSASTAPLAPRASSAQITADDQAAVAALTQQAQRLMADRNRAVAGTGLVVARVELLLRPDSPAALVNGGSTVLAADHAHRSGIRWVPGDPRRGGRTVVTYGTFQPLMLAAAPLGSIDPSVSIDAAAQTWSNVACSGLRLRKQTLPEGYFPSVLLAPPGAPFVPATDIGIVGWLPGSVFSERLGPAGRAVLGATWVYAWRDAKGNPTDIDHDGNDDAAYVEQWFQNGGELELTWSNAPTPVFGGVGYDAQYVELHELGHAIGLTHFGRIVSDRDGTMRVSPVAVMNAAAQNDLRTPLGPDEGGLCSLYAGWPTR